MKAPRTIATFASFSYATDNEAIRCANARSRALDAQLASRPGAQWDTWRQYSPPGPVFSAQHLYNPAGPFLDWELGIITPYSGVYGDPLTLLGGP
jgi:hypothetical protein